MTELTERHVMSRQNFIRSYARLVISLTSKICKITRETTIIRLSKILKAKNRKKESSSKKVS